MRFDQERADRFLVAVRAGASNDVAAGHAGLDAATVFDWLGGDTDAKAAFRRDVDKARSDLGLFAVGVVQREISRDPTKPNIEAAKWLAEKTWGDAELERLRRLTT